MTTNTTLAPTPGPWTVYNNRVCVWVYAPDGKPVCKVDDAARIEARANATIIAAAPDLLAALRMCADFIENVDESTPDRTERFFACRESWRRAIARAEAQS